MGSAIECFKSAGAIVVPRTRFAPVKTCNDLFVLRSDAYKVPPPADIHYHVHPPVLACQLACPQGSQAWAFHTSTCADTYEYAISCI